MKVRGYHRHNLYYSHVKSDISNLLHFEPFLYNIFLYNIFKIQIIFKAIEDGERQYVWFLTV